MPQLQYLSRGSRPRLAYQQLPGRSPGIVYLPGYQSDMNNEKCLALRDFCCSSGQAFLRFDYRGCGNSEGNFEDSILGHWRDDVLSVLDELTTGPQILVGASMGSWLMYLAALDRPQRVAGLVGTGTAVNAFINLFHSLPEEVQQDVASKGFYTYPMTGSETGYSKFTYALLQEAEKHGITQSPIPVTCPVRMLHALDDDVVPWRRSVEVAERLESRDVSVILRTHGGHTLIDSNSLGQLLAIVKELINSIATNQS
ncbi:palmitoyl-protein thioesterase ABHD10, mitochondrial-like [Ambystoma mexicanum]|uniref:palmitoyl-protein thioesterase ABHD10, mitochondrial-like n=1 Tax=Ambystoma mexicanum TaxID=8296 RepID=UPI0037E99618